MEVVANDINIPNIATYRLLPRIYWPEAPDLAYNSSYEYQDRNNIEM